MQWVESSWFGQTSYTATGQFAVFTIMKRGEYWRISILEIQDDAWYVPSWWSRENVQRFAENLYREALQKEIQNFPLHPG